MAMKTHSIVVLTFARQPEARSVRLQRLRYRASNIWPYLASKDDVARNIIGQNSR